MTKDRCYNWQHLLINTYKSIANSEMSVTKVGSFNIENSKL
jgi:hypothetical protein